MLERLTVRAADLAASARFYDTVLAALGFERTTSSDSLIEWAPFALAPAADGESPTRRLHIGFRAPTQEQVDAFWQAGIDAGYRDDGEPGPRPVYGDDYYGGFLLDPDGNSAEAVFGGSADKGGVIDHVWIRVADVAAARDDYAPRATGFEPQPIAPEPGNEDNVYVQFRSPVMSFSLVGGEPSEAVLMEFSPDVSIPPRQVQRSG
jgi:catechol 2,3-dioxygenase-like lactoylglutathione lyase family enzyme